MAPTEVLAEQHAAEVARLLAGLTVPDATTLEGLSRQAQVLLAAAQQGAPGSALFARPGFDNLGKIV